MTTTEPATLNVGDIMYSSWGYDQTNVDFYKVVRTTAKSAWIVSIGSKQVEGSEGFMCAHVVPDPERVLDEKPSMHRIRRYLDHCSLRLSSYSFARTYQGGDRGLYSSWYA